MQGIYHQSLTGNQGQLGPFDPSIIIFNTNKYLSFHTGFLHLFDNVKDPRREGKIVYRLSDILLMMLLYTLQQKRQSMVHLHDWLQAKKHS